jgi:hypothetical protein
MKNLSLVVCLLLASRLIGQQANTSLDFVSGFDYTYRTLRKKDHTSQDLLLEARNENEKPRVNARFGFNYSHRVSNSITLKTGLRYAHVGYLLSKEDDLQWPSQHNGQGGFDPNLPGEFETLKLFFQYRFIEIPLVLRYTFKPISAKRVTTFLEAGISPNVYVGTRYVSKQDKDAKVNTFHDDRVKPVHFAAQLAYGLNYNLKNSDALFYQTNLRFHLNETVSGFNIEEHLYSFGLEIGYRKALTRS